jgi:hypothetical protein
MVRWIFPDAFAGAQAAKLIMMMTKREIQRKLSGKRDLFEDRKEDT